MITNYLDNDRPTPMADMLLQINSSLFWKGADYSTLMVEGGFVFCMFWLPAMRVIATVAVFFHSFVYFSMDILFIFNLLAYASLLDLRVLLGKAWVRRPVRRFHFLAQRAGLAPLLALSLLLVGAFYVTEHFEINSTFLRDNITIAAALVVAILSVIHFLGRLADRLIFGHDFPLSADHAMVILYDGNCGLCDRWVQFVLAHDPRGLICFAPLQSGRGKELLAESGSTVSDLSTMVFLVDNRASFRSTAALMILRQLRGPCAMTGVLGLIPAALRDLVYNFVAANRHSWFPKTGESCLLPTARERARFLS